MPTPKINVVFDPPTPTDELDIFDAKSFDTFAKMNQFGTEANALAEGVNAAVATVGPVMTNIDVILASPTHAASAASNAALASTHKNQAAASAAAAQASANNAAAIVYQGGSSLTPSGGKIPLARADGTIDPRWLGETAAAILQSASVRVNDIGTPGMVGFGQGIAPSLPAGYSALPGTFTLGSAEYGCYRYSDGSEMAWIPAFYYRFGHPENPTYAQYGANSLDIKPFSAFASVADANAQGYALHRAFYDAGIVPGFMADKYGCSNNGGIASSIKNGNPLSSAAAHNPFSALTGTPPNTYAGAIQAAKTRGAQFFPVSRFQVGALALLSLAHGQSAKSTASCAWYDPVGVTNFPKGNNNNAFGDINDPTVVYQPDGYQQCGKTGSGAPFAKTTHNGLECGIADLNGNMYSINLGMTCIAADKAITGATQSNPVNLTISSHGYTSGAKILVTGIVGMTQLNNRIFEVTVVDPDTISLNGVNGTAFTAYTSGGTATKGTFYATKTSVKMEDYTGGNTLATDHWGTTGVAATMDPIIVPMRSDYPNNGSNQCYGNGSSAVFSSATAGNEWLLASLALPLVGGMSNNGINLFGQDLFTQYIRNELCVLSGFEWTYSSYAGVLGASLTAPRTNTYASVGLRSASYPIR